MRIPVDLTNQNFGRLTALRLNGRDGHGNRTWECLCSCGKTVYWPSFVLKRGAARSCGCLKHDLSVAKTGNLTDQRFGKLVVLSMAGFNQKGRSQCFCRCDCGVELLVDAARLKIKNGSRSCGCGRLEGQLRQRRREHKESGGRTGGFNQIYSKYKNGAEERQLLWDLDEKAFFELTSSACFYCNMPPLQTGKSRLHPYLHNGIDRIDNARGYERDNVAPCCKTCNYMKRALGVKEFLLHVRRIAAHQQSLPVNQDV